MSIPVFLARQIREVERRAAAESPDPPLMERAGAAVAELAQRLLGDRDKRILLFAGPGNNGGDAFVAARLLKQGWFDVRVMYAGDVAMLPNDARKAAERWRQAGGAIVDRYAADFRPALLVDGLFGIGLQRPLGGDYADLVARMNGSGVPILSIDIPSGLDADTGAVLGDAVRARHTLTLLGLKPGLLTREGPDHAGEIHVDNLGQDIAMPDPGGALIESSILQNVLPPRSLNSHKGSHGTVAVVGGASGMVGAALLTGRAALKTGAGKVRVGLLADTQVVDGLQPELMLGPVEDVLAMKDVTCVAAGPGLGTSQPAAHALAAVLKMPLPLVLDADALNLLAVDASLQALLRSRDAPALLTPHPAEAARLLGLTTAEIQMNRVACAQALSRQFDAVTVLKGVGSICAFPDGNWRINCSGNPGLAAAGMGDVLTGILAGLLAQGADPADAMLAAVHLHGTAADHLAANGIGPVGMTASELIDAARTCLNAAQAGKSR